MYEALFKMWAAVAVERVYWKDVGVFSLWIRAVRFMCEGRDKRRLPDGDSSGLDRCSRGLFAGGAREEKEKLCRD